MNAWTALNCCVILAGAAVMLVSIARAGGLATGVAYVRERHRRQMELYLLWHRGLMVFFLLGYVAVAAAFVWDFPVFSQTFVSVIFLLGAVFVFFGVAVQSRLLAEVNQTLQGVLPICAACKRIRVPGGEPKDPRAWRQMEAYVSERAAVRFTHGYCPECYAKEMGRLDAKEGGT
ncbi:MAG: hypothetical protein HY924_07155 [Elusimicrobia bacterium]|nr:hypothetical protein [Elusimicrobiota bacterium]